MTRETVPSNHVLALVKNIQTAVSAADELEGMDFERPIIVTNEHVGERLEQESGLLARLFQRMSNHLSEETKFLEQYEQAVRDGSIVIAVKASGEEDVERVTEVLKRHHAMNLRFFGVLAVSDLTPDSNPSAGSDEARVTRPVEGS